MLHFLLIFNFIFQLVAGSKHDYGDDGKLDPNLALELRNDANLDLSKDEEYEDLRAEFLAYHTVLSSLAGDQSPARRSMKSTPCWKRSGICINYKLCTGFKFRTQVPGCKDKHKVCCLLWDQYNIRDFKEEGIGTLGFPWTLQRDFGGQGVIAKETKTSKKEKKKRAPKTNLRSKDNKIKSIAFVLYD